ncbi:hypothetical protein VaNZ11_014772 [Volvox africanus]|uniref:Uncharacterized protein n=1 Tax=Volvox africanus TaxID=51714 RepID=A0ABQ5SJT7_9CHLO|nr:hypothetical protein VaNZ11_014772 [Volvox africanus]
MVRFKNRYLLAEVAWNGGTIDASYNEQMLLQALRENLSQNFGDYGLGTNLAGLLVKYFNPYTGLAIVRCGTSEVQRVVTALAFTTKIKQRSACVRVLRVTGALSACKDAAMRLSETRLALNALPQEGPVRAQLTKQQLAVAEQLHNQLLAVEL